MVDDSMKFGRCPLSPCGDDCNSDCELWVQSEGCCSIRLIAMALGSLEELYAETQGYEIREGGAI